MPFSRASLTPCLDAGNILPRDYAADYLVLELNSFAFDEGYLEDHMAVLASAAGLLDILADRRCLSS